MNRNDAYALRAVIESNAQATSASRTDDENIAISVLYPKWKKGNHKAGEVYNAIDQTWECYSDYDNAVYPDIVPGSTAWPTFNRPLHGKTRETARPYVQPTHSLDIYKYGEWTIFTDGRYYECIAPDGTNFSPAEYPAGWREDEAI